MAKNKSKNKGNTQKAPGAYTLPKVKKMAESEEPVQNEEKYMRVAPAAETKVRKLDMFDM
jgi:hypothetical protein